MPRETNPPLIILKILNDRCSIKVTYGKFIDPCQVMAGLVRLVKIIMS
jgi:hypothetical protein